jgi:hypothetical protein
LRLVSLGAATEPPPSELTSDEISTESSLREIPYYSGLLAFYLLLSTLIVFSARLTDRWDSILLLHIGQTWAQLWFTTRLAAGATALTLVWTLVSTLAESALIVRAIVDSLHASTHGGDSRWKPSSADLAGKRPRHLFCATDLSTGEHVYITSDEVLMVGKSFTPADVSLGEAVAASACFPGFRPISLDERQLGRSASTDALVRLRGLPRTIIGLIGIIAFGNLVTFFILLLLGKLSAIVGAGWYWGVSLPLSLIAAIVSIRILQRQAGAIHLVDGGVCDNLGPAFAVLSQDNRYAALDSMLFGEQEAATKKILLVVDASKALSDEGLSGRIGVLALVPFRIRMLARSTVQLLSTANGNARRRAIEHLLSLKPDMAGAPEMAGAVVSLNDTPTSVYAWLDWGGVVRSNLSVPTTLRRISDAEAAALMTHGYALTADFLGRISSHWRPPEQITSFESLTGVEARRVTRRAIKNHLTGPSGRRYRFLRLMRRIVAFAVAIPALWFVAVSVAWLAA